MKNTALFFFIFATSSLSAQLVDDFSDGDFTNNPTWSGNDTKFEVDGSFQLHLNALAVTDVGYLSTPSQSINNAVWEFYVEMDFNPSSSNQARIYLVSDQADLTGSLNGYFVKAGNTTDEISLYRQDGNTEVEIIDGTDDKMDVALAKARIMITRDSVGNWELLSDTSGNFNYVSEGTVTDNNYVQTQFFGVHCQYTSTRSDKFYYDDFNVAGTPFVDTISPVVTSLTVVNDTQLDLQFNEPVDITTAEDGGNYLVSNFIGFATSAVRDLTDSSLVHLTFGNAFQEDFNYQLYTNNVEDNSGNVMPFDTRPFVYFIPVPPVPNVIVINEIFADPSPQVALPNAEFVEFYNRSQNSFNLKNWKFSDASSSVTLPDFVLTPNSYVILCDDEDKTTYEFYGTTIGVSSFPSLNNGGDDLTLEDSTGQKINTVQYDDTWYRDNDKNDGGWTLELVNPNHPCSGKDNWRASETGQGGSPGLQNSVYDTLPDTNPPNPEQVIPITQTQVELHFSENMDSTSVANATYTLDNGINVIGVQPIGPYFKEVLLDLDAPLDSTLVYEITITGATDCSGNLLHPTAISFGIGVVPIEFEIMITEIFPDPSPTVALPDAEFVEIYNRSNRVIDLSGSFFTDQSSFAQFPENTVLVPREYLILCDDGFEEDFKAFGKVVAFTTMPSLNNTDEVISIRRKTDSVIVHEVHYYDTWYRDEEKKEGGWTLELKNPNDPCATSTNWIASNHNDGGTPGQQNSVNKPFATITTPTVTGVSVLSTSQIEVFFSKRMDDQSLANGTYPINKGVTVVEVIPIAPDYVSVKLNLSPAIKRGELYTLDLTGIFDCRGEALGNTTPDFVYPNIGDIIVNEVLFNPIGTGSDFVEVYNNSLYDINIQNWGLGQFDSNNSFSTKTVSDSSYILKARQYAVFTEDGENIKFEYPKAREETFIETDLPTYSNSDGSVILVDNLGETIDQFDYDENMHFALLDDVDGVSLERLDFNRPTNDATNWHSAAAIAGYATPGYENSQFNPGEAAESNITIAPEVFSPNNDGIDDVLNINYSFDESGYVANVTIFDSNGRLTRKLAQNELLATEGTMSWDGINENNEKARIGIYVIYFEVFNLSGDVVKFKKPAVVASRL